MAKQQSVSAITALPLSPQDDRRSRMTKYLIAMSIRVVCIILCFFVQGWWLLLPAIGAIVLPYLAVIFANVGAEPGGSVLRPGSTALVRQQPIIPDEAPVDSSAASTDGGAATDEDQRSTW